MLRVDDVLPKYYKLFQELKRAIDDGELQPGQALASERDLIKLHMVSRGTVRQAIDALERAGYVIRKQGAGTFVAPSKLKHDSHHLAGFSEDMEIRGMIPGQQVLSFSYIEPPAFVVATLELTTDVKQVLKIERLRTADGEPMGLQTTYLPFSMNRGFSVEDLIKYQSLYKLLEDKFNLVIYEADETMEATISDEEQSKILNIPIGGPLIKLDRIAWTDTRKPMEFTQMVYRGDRYRYFWHITRVREQS